MTKADLVEEIASRTGVSKNHTALIVDDLLLKVSVRVSNSRYSSDYVLRSVTHTLGRSEYTQSFSVLGNAVSPEKTFGASAPSPAAAVGLAFNAQVDII